ncbi:uncharacterized protein BP01DRAFT_369563 [Aspergillus saccharolyticus JOP 1030-1]|uniref:Uncharacterized protein n=1 Tax=Aspergillus saccharolyticus JOP 1030-1 TaxID=1450539 RepID=A0A318ZBN3_9EURO|nr:hypothetical protein BP01DRAFT_369563 [Aspergillus saccharolyticus JOP 1030-1]PYH40880.1 hypothetical protein BP01DRAFT_369563 [Aspergillus saccharolyticus JOP 1030-1]
MCIKPQGNHRAVMRLLISLSTKESRPVTRYLMRICVPIILDPGCSASSYLARSVIMRTALDYNTDVIAMIRKKIVEELKENLHSAKVQLELFEFESLYEN